MLVFDFWFVQNPWFPVQTQEFENVKGDTLFGICIAGEKSCMFATFECRWAGILVGFFADRTHLFTTGISFIQFTLLAWKASAYFFLSTVTKRKITKWNSGEKHKKCQDFFPNVNLRMPGKWRMRHVTFSGAFPRAHLAAPGQTEWHGFALPLTSFNMASWAERQERAPLSLKLNIFNSIHVCAWDWWDRYFLKYFCSAPSNFVAVTESLWLT